MDYDARVIPKKYPHLMPLEVKVWRKWMSRHGDRFSRYVYDVRVGESYDVPEGTDAAIGEMWEHLGRKRIDVVAWRGPQPTIIEVAPIGTTRQVGQMVTYTILFRRDFPWVETISLLLICARLQPDIGYVCEALGIQVDHLEDVDGLK